MSRCKSCFHSKTQTGKSDASCRECNICIRNPEFASKRNFDKKITIEGVTFEAPMDMYISRDRMRYEDYMRMKKIMEALARKERELGKLEWPKFPQPIIRPDSNPITYPYWVSPSFEYRTWQSANMKRRSIKHGKNEKSN